MPPSRHSGSSRSAHKDSDQMPVDNMYVLGDYHFALERTSVPGSTNDKIEAICTKLNESKSARKSIQVPSSTQIDGWYVEANETEASVYVKIKQTVPLGEVTYPFPYNTGGGSGYSKTGKAYAIYSAPYVAHRKTDNYHIQYCLAAGESGVVGHVTDSTEAGRKTEYDIPLTSTATYNGKTVYYTVSNPGTTGYYSKGVGSMDPPSLVGSPNWGGIAWMMVYGGTVEDSDKLVGRFAIDLEDAGGDGPDSDWDDPGDGGDPTYTLYVTVTGALSGRHNDPIVDPSYSYIPADKDTVKDYGCGGDGGHGGGGGAGASTVVVHKFATNQAGNKEITALARRHGYGSGGGKGGKGGDGCILVYY